MDMLRPASSRGVLSLLAVVIGLAAWSASCSAQTSNPPSAPPATVEHALSNKIWRASDGQIVTVGDLVGGHGPAFLVPVPLANPLSLFKVWRVDGAALAAAL